MNGVCVFVCTVPHSNPWRAYTIIPILEMRKPNQRGKAVLSQVTGMRPSQDKTLNDSDSDTRSHSTRPWYLPSKALWLPETSSQKSQKTKSNWLGPEMELVPLPRGAKVVAVTHSWPRLDMNAELRMQGSMGLFCPELTCSLESSLNTFNQGLRKIFKNNLAHTIRNWHVGN